mgnify:CR=1 FL=1
MSDDRRREDNTGEYGTNFGDDFGTVSFGGNDTDEQPTISFGKSDTGPLPHWSEPPTGELPRFIDDAPSGETDVWSSFGGASDDTTRAASRPAESRAGDPSRPVRRDITSEGPLFGGTIGDSGTIPATPAAPLSDSQARGTTSHSMFDDEAIDISREVARDFTDERRRPVHRPGVQQPRNPMRAGVADRDMPTAVTAGLVIAAVFLAALLWKPAAVVVLVALALGAGSVEFFTKVGERGYRPAAFCRGGRRAGRPNAEYRDHIARCDVDRIDGLVCCADSSFLNRRHCICARRHGHALDHRRWSSGQRCCGTVCRKCDGSHQAA